MKLSDIREAFETFAPVTYQENYDNTGLQVGEDDQEVSSALLCIDITGEILEEAVALGANLIISHHPVLFNPLKKITSGDITGRILIKAIRKGIALYSMHTNLDNMLNGVNHKICEKLGLTHVRILQYLHGKLRKLVTFVPASHADLVRLKLFEAGAGHIGNYDQCSYNLEGTGSFRGLGSAKPFVGEKGKLHFEKETRIETIFHYAIQTKIIQALLNVHPYEEVAYDIYPLDNDFTGAGAGMIGNLENPLEELSFLKKMKEIFHCEVIRHSPLLNKSVKTIAVCGGSGASLIKNAIASGADMYITGDIKYHQFFEADNKIVLADIGHYESEQFTIEIFYEILRKNFPNFAIHFSKINTSPINYF